jgi:hypothetical protein
VSAMNHKHYIGTAFCSALMLLALTANHLARAADCPAGTVKVGEREEETPDAIIVHPLCQKIAQPVSPKGAAAAFCTAKAEKDLDQAAIRSLGFGINAGRFDEWNGEATNLRNQFELEAVDALFDALFLDPAVDYAKSLNPWDVNTRTKALRAALSKVGLEPGMVETAMRGLAFVKDKPAMAPAAKQAISEAVNKLLEAIKMAKLDVETRKKAKGDDTPAAVGALIFAGKIAVKNPWAGLTITGAEMAKTASMAYGLNLNVDRLSRLNNVEMKQLVLYKNRLDHDVEMLRLANQQLADVAEPVCTP